MEISGSLTTTWQPASDRGNNPQTSRPDAQNSQANSPAEPGPLREYISRGEIVQEKGSADYREALSQARRGRDNGESSGQAWSAQRTQRAQQALEAYQNNANTVENGGVELLPRVDSYA